MPRCSPSRVLLTLTELDIPGVVNTPNERIAPINNFGWYTLSIGSGQTLNVQDGNTTNASTALYVNELLGLSVSGGMVQNITGGTASDPINIYYNAANAANFYFSGGTNLDIPFATGFGAVKWDPTVPSSPVPLPPSVLLLGSGLLGLGAMGWRRKHQEG